MTTPEQLSLMPTATEAIAPVGRLKTKRLSKGITTAIAKDPPRVFSFGGGVQSMACLVLAAQGKLPYRTFLFSNVGDDSEYPATMRYLREIAIPYAELHGIQLIELKKKRRDGSTETLLEKLHRTRNSIDIPVRMANGAPGRRACTGDFKIKVIARWVKAKGATVERPGHVGVGISLDEWHRSKPSQIPYIENEYPLLELEIDRLGCERLIREAGLPVPPKSSCWFCPFHTLRMWQHLYDTEPELFWKAVELERTINSHRAGMFDRQGRPKDPVYLTDKGRPLDQVVTGAHQQQMSLLGPVEDSQYSCGAFVCDGTGGEGELVITTTDPKTGKTIVERIG